MFRIEIDSSEVKAAMAAGATELVKDMRQAAAHASQVATRQMKAVVPVKSGDLQKSIEPRLRSTHTGAAGEINVGEDYASYVKDGTKPHMIVAKNLGVGGTLRFEIGGRTIFRRSVNHPGTKPNDFVTPGVVEGQQVLDHDAEQAVRKLKSRIEG